MSVSWLNSSLVWEVNSLSIDYKFWVFTIMQALYAYCSNKIPNMRKITESFDTQTFAILLAVREIYSYGIIEC